MQKFDSQYILNKVILGKDLTFKEMKYAMNEIMNGSSTPVFTSAFLVALRIKKESVDEIAAGADVMRNFSKKVILEKKLHENLVDTCGTGGDAHGTFNISTASVFVSSSCGARVAKHGGRSVSSKSGSADVLEALGVNVNLSAENISKCIEAVGAGFMFAPNHHSAMKHAAPVRKDLGIKTLFNILGPLTNPAGALNQVIGVFNKDLTKHLAEVLKKLGSQHVIVVHGMDGMDEISISDSTLVTELKNDEIKSYEISPEKFGFARQAMTKIKVDNLEDAKKMFFEALSNESQAASNILALNAGAAIYCANKADSLIEGVEIAYEAIRQGKALKKFEEFKSYVLKIKKQ